jgi:hypothetical protein
MKEIAPTTILLLDTTLLKGCSEVLLRARRDRAARPKVVNQFPPGLLLLLLPLLPPPPPPLPF